MELEHREKIVRDLFNKELGNLSKDVPVLMFPLRIETHFRHKEQQKQLCVRILPDELMLDYHTEKLAQSEVDAGKFFWLQWYIASGNADREYEAWDVLCKKYPVYRAAWICRCLKPDDIDSFKRDGRLFYRRPYTDMDVVLESCRMIYTELSKITLSDNQKQTDTGEYKLEHDLRLGIRELRKYLFQIDSSLSSCEFIVDYLYDKISEAVAYMQRKLEAVHNFYNQYPGMYDHNSRKLELWDIDFTELVTFRKDVDNYLAKIEKMRISLEDMVALYLNDNRYKVFADFEVKEEEKLDIPVSNVLPDRFYFIGEIDNENEEDLLYAVGKPVKKDLQMSFDLNSDTALATITDEKKDLEVEEGLAWMFDYAAAEEAGMAITVPIDENVNAFRYIYVVGVNSKSANNPALLENLFVGHNYSVTGLELLNAGHPTNLVDGGPQAVVLTEEEVKRRRYEIEVDNAYLKDDNFKEYDTFKLASFLNMDYDKCWGRVLKFDTDQSAKTQQVYAYLWNKYVDTLPQDVREMDGVKRMLNFVGNFASENIKPFGTLPTLAVDNIPYGILPITNYITLYKMLERYAISREDKMLKELLCQLINLCKKWKDIRKSRVKYAEALNSYEYPEKDYLEMAGQTPHSVSFVERKVIHSPFIPLNYPECNESKYISMMMELDYFGGQGVDNAFTDASIDDMVQSVKSQYSLGDDEAFLLVSTFFDTFTYRLDAWFSAVLSKIYRGHEHLPCVGAYGWVFNLKENCRAEVENKDSVIADLQLEDVVGDSKIYKNVGDDKGHYIMAPSLQHALTAAVLRSGYLKNSKGESDTHICVNLSSARVRQALRLVDGVKAGMSLSVVLGADLERYMHDDEQELDRLIYPMRELFPLTIDIEAGNGDSRAQDYTMHVVNGEAFLNTFLTKWNYDGPVSEWLENQYNCPTKNVDWIALLSDIGLSNAERKAFFLIVERIADSFDALNDLLLSEGVHRLVKGDKASYYAISNFMATGEGNLPEPDVLRSPMEKVVVTHKAGLLLPDELAPSKPMALASPSINAWISNQLGDMSAIKFGIRLEADNMAFDNVKCSLGELSVSAIEFLYLSKYPDTLKKYLETRWRAMKGIFKGKVTIFFSLLEMGVGKDAEELDIYTNEIRLKKIRDLVLNARSMKVSDWLSAVYEDTENESYVDINELSDRYDSVVAKINGVYDAVVAWQKSVAEEAAMSVAQVFEGYSILCDCVECGLVNCLTQYDADAFFDTSVLDPASNYLVYNKALEKQAELKDQLDFVCKQLSERLDAAKLIVESDEKKHSSQKFVEGIKSLLLDNFRVEERFFLKKEGTEPCNFTPMLEGGLAYYGNLDDDKFDTWQDEMSEVRQNMRNWHQLNMVQTAYDVPMGDVSVVQTDSDGNLLDGYWMGLEVEKEDYLADANSLVLYNSGVFKPADDAAKSYAGIIFDSWVEFIPYKKHTAGLIIHCDRPDNEAPQALMLAIHPKVAFPEDDKWDSEALLNVFGFTRLLSMNRAVEPDHLYSEGSTHLLFPLIGRTLISFGARGRFTSQSSYGPVDPDADIFDVMCGGDLLKDL